MPSITSISGYTLTNLGPMTTTFSPPTTCASSAMNVLLAASSNPTSFRWGVDCDKILQVLDCLPSGSQVKTITQSGGSLDSDVIKYLSPGNICPSGWQTVGTAARSGNGQPSLSGVFEAARTEPLSGYNGALAPNILAAALDNSETAVICCPSTMSALPNGACFSPMADYTVTAGCAAVVSSDQFSEADSDGNHRTLSISTTIFDSKETSSYIGVSTMPGVLMVHQPSSTGPVPSSAAGLHPAGASMKGTGSLLGFISAAIVLGATIVLL